MKTTTKRLLAILAAATLPLATLAGASPKPGSLSKVDTSSSAGAVDLTKCSSAHATYGAAGAFDGKKDTDGRWLATKADHMFVTYRFNTATRVSAIKLYNPNANSETTRPPKAWTFEGSNDGENWTTLDTRTAQTGWTSGQIRTYSFQNDDAYVYYKFDCTELNGATDYLMLWEIEFYSAAPGEAPVDLTTSSSGGVSSASATHDSYPASKAFDGNRSDTNGRWLSSIGDHMYLIYHFNAPTAVNAISVWNGSDSGGGWNSAGRAPKAWTFSGSNDGENWTTLDTQTSETAWAANSEERYYTFVNRTAYEYYKYDCTELNGGTDYLQLWELEFYYMNTDEPKLGTVELARAGAGAYTVTATEAANTADLFWLADNGTAISTNLIQAGVAEGSTVSASVMTSGLAADATYQISVLAANDFGADESVAGTLYAGALALGATTDANEYGLVAGGVVVARASADPWPLTVNYAISGSAGSEGVTWVAPAAVTIPANAASATLPVVPLTDPDVTADVAITVSLAAGNYELPSVNTATLTLANLVAPTGYNVWISPSNSLASIGANWSSGTAPTAADNVLFSGYFSSTDCEWDAAATATVASWTQSDGYAGTVTFDTEFPDYDGATFPLFTVTGDCVLNSGSWTCRGNYHNYGVSSATLETYRTGRRWCLNVAVGGAMTVAAGAAVNATGKGYGYTSGTGTANFPPAYGGYAHGGSTAPYGSVKQPFDPGLGCLSQGDQRKKPSGIGGGAIKLVIVGTLTVNGSIAALGTVDENVARSGGTGGSIWIDAAQITGTGTINASACPSSNYTSDQAVALGSGGRIALYTQSPLAFPVANVSCNGTAYRGTVWSSTTRISGPGTIFVYDPAQTNGTLYVKQSRDFATTFNKWTGTPVIGDLALDAVVLSGYAHLRIPSDSSLTLPSLAAVTTDNGACSAGLIFDGGTLDIGNGDQTLSANVAFASPTPFSFPGDLTLEPGARLGSAAGAFGQSASQYDTTLTVSVAGDLTIPAGASAGATRCASITASKTGPRTASHGGQSLYLAEGARTNGFDSVLHPSMPGGSVNNNFAAGGVFNLAVGGTLTLDGAISANGGGARGSDSTYDGASAGAGGTLAIVAGALAGEGSMSAEGGCGRYNYAGGAGGGRIAVRLTNAGAVFSDHWKTNITAYGESFRGGNGKAASAGTVYLQAANEAEATGTVVIRNDLALQAAAASNPATTRYPGNGEGCDTSDALKRTSLVVAGAAHVELTDSARAVNLSIETGSTIDLAGHTLTVRHATLGGAKLSSGTYAAGDTAVEGFVTDGGEGGSLVITGGATIFIVK